MKILDNNLLKQPDAFTEFLLFLGDHNCYPKWRRACRDQNIDVVDIMKGSPTHYIDAFVWSRTVEVDGYWSDLDSKWAKIVNELDLWL